MRGGSKRRLGGNAKANPTEYVFSDDDGEVRPVQIINVEERML